MWPGRPGRPRKGRNTLPRRSRHCGQGRREPEKHWSLTCDEMASQPESFLGGLRQKGEGESSRAPSACARPAPVAGIHLFLRFFLRSEEEVVNRDSLLFEKMQHAPDQPDSD